MQEKKQPEASDRQQDSTEVFERAIIRTTGSYVLRLYVTGLTPNSQRAIENIRSICSEYLEGRYSLEIIDIYQQPEYAKEARIIAVPTLIKELPLPLRRFIGDMSQKEKLLLGLDIEVKN